MPVGFVTGGGSGIGRAIVEKLVGSGYTVAVYDLNEKSLEELLSVFGDKVFPWKGDVTSWDEVKRSVEGVVNRFGRIDLLVNNAGWDTFGFFVDQDPEVWDKIVRVNLFSVFYFCKAVLPIMIEKKGGAIVNVASDAGRVGSSGEAVYSSAKGGVIAFTKALAREVARYEIRVNCVCPGPTDTPLLHSLFQGEEGKKILEGIVRSTPFRRLAHPSEVAEAVVFLGSPSARFITGQVLSVSGGLTMAG
jgi:2-hydroxycyclohexanecarboxyl-CoA dehydrogenase